MKQKTDPEGAQSPSPVFLKALIRTALVLSDLVIAMAAAGLEVPWPEWAVFLVTFAGLLLTELLLWSRLERLFR